MTLATLDISKARDELSGKLIEPAFEWLTGTIRYARLVVREGLTLIFHSHPKPFRCEIKPRFSAAVDLIKHAIVDEDTSRA